MADTGTFSHARPRAAYACDPACSRGRLHPEAESANRNAFQRDRDRIIHSAAFRRLKHKTQVFVYHEGDHYRTRLTHSLEVAQIARSVARSLGLDEDLSEALALAHDLGHPPFGHAGEEALAAAMEPYGGFDHNGQTLRVLTRLEARYAEFDGLNLTWETLEGVVKHNGPLMSSGAARLPWAVADYNVRHDLKLHTWPSAEAQVASLADDVAYNAHDLDDGLRAGLFGVEDLHALPLAGPVVREVQGRYPGLETTRLVHETKRRLIDAMVADMLAESRRQIAGVQLRSPNDVRGLGRPVIRFSAAMAEINGALKAFLHERMYRHFRVNRMTSKARRAVRDLFVLFVAEPECLPSEWQAQIKGREASDRARLVCDYIAGMTDRYALDEHRRVYDLYEENR
jgi:dGTPase